MIVLAETVWRLACAPQPQAPEWLRWFGWALILGGLTVVFLLIATRQRP